MDRLKESFLIGEHRCTLRKLVALGSGEEIVLPSSANSVVPGLVP
jgi:hypothetical protein